MSEQSEPEPLTVPQFAACESLPAVEALHDAIREARRLNELLRTEPAPLWRIAWGEAPSLQNPTDGNGSPVE